MAYTVSMTLAVLVVNGTKVAWPGTPTTVLVLGFLVIVFWGIVTSTVFLQAIVAAAVLERARGRNPTLATSWKTVWRRRRALLAWAVASTAFAFFVVLLARAGGLFGRFVAAMSTVAWEIATVFVVPTILAEGGNVWGALHASERTFRQGFGNNLAAMGGFGLTTAGITLALMFAGPPIFTGLPFILAEATGVSNEVAFGMLIGGLILWGAALVFWVGLSAVLHGIQGSLLFTEARTRTERIRTWEGRA